MWRSSCSPAWTSRQRSGRSRRPLGLAVWARRDDRPQRHVRGSPGRNRARLGRRGRVRRRHQLRRRRARRPPGALPLPRRDHRRLGWRLRRGPRGPLRRGPQRGRPRPGDEPRVLCSRRISGWRAPELAQEIHAGRIDERRVIELAPLVLEQAPRPTPSPARSSSGWQPRWRRMARVALTRLDLQREPVEVLLGGGLLQTASDGLLRTIASALAETGPGDHRARDALACDRRRSAAGPRRTRLEARGEGAVA